MCVWMAKLKVGEGRTAPRVRARSLSRLSTPPHPHPLRQGRHHLKYGSVLSLGTAACARVDERRRRAQRGGKLFLKVVTCLRLAGRAPPFAALEAALRSSLDRSAAAALRPRFEPTLPVLGALAAASEPPRRHFGHTRGSHEK